MSAAGRFHAPQRTSGSAYVVIPISGLATLEHPLALVAGDDLVEEPLLRARVVQVVVDDLVAERGARHRSRLERGRRLAQARREARDVGLVRVALERRLELEALLDAVQARGEQRGEREVRVRVGAGDASLRAQRVAVPDDAEAARAVVVAPRECRRRPAPGGVALVRVDRRREEDRELARARDLPGDELLEDVGLAGERALAVAPERRVDVARAADRRVVGLRHERDRAAGLLRE